MNFYIPTLVWLTHNTLVVVLVFDAGWLQSALRFYLCVYLTFYFDSFGERLLRLLLPVLTLSAASFWLMGGLRKGFWGAFVFSEG